MQNQFYPGSQSSNNNHAQLGPPPSQSFSYNQLNGPSNGANQMQGETLLLPVPARNRSARSPRKRNMRMLVFSSAGGLFVLFGALFLVTQLISKTSHNVTLYQVNVQNITQNVGGGVSSFPSSSLC